MLRALTDVSAGVSPIGDRVGDGVLGEGEAYELPVDRKGPWPARTYDGLTR